MVPALISFLRKFSIISALLTACLPSPCVGLNHPVNETKRSAALLGALEISAGVYHNQTDNPSLKKTVLITGCNHGYLPFLHNFKCFIDRLNLKLLVISMDHRTHSHIENKLSSTLKSFLWIGEQTVQESFATFRSPQFNVITHAKTSYTHAILSLGYDVIFIDLDIALVRDPLPYLFWEGVDYVFTHNKICPQ